jgi:phosphatidylcholine synthase
LQFKPLSRIKDDQQPSGEDDIVRAWAAAVHVFTALGAVCALFAARAVIAHDAEALFIWLGIALFVDGIDGTFARKVNVAENLPRFSGERLDLVIDYITYVFVPVLALLEWNYLDGALGNVLASAILLSSLYHFTDVESKSDDYCFLGFPAIWNIFAFYVFVLDPPNWVTALAVVAAVIGTFVPMPWIHPLRVVALRPLTLAAVAASAVASVALLANGFPAPLWTQLVLGAVGIYFTVLAVAWWLSKGRDIKTPAL